MNRSEAVIKHRLLWGCFLLVLGLQVALWLSVRDMRPSWGNVPPVPSVAALKMRALGDGHMAYRLAALMLQNIGNTGGYTARFEEYDYDSLIKWFERASALDARSDMLPLLAAYYFSATSDAPQLRALTGYLAQAGDSAQGQKWRWLAQAVYLARFRLKDNDLALRLARKLAALENPAMPAWTRRMPVIILSDLGEKEAAYTMMKEILTGSAETLSANEIRVMIEYMCTHLGDIPDKDRKVLCKAYPNP